MDVKRRADLCKMCDGYVKGWPCDFKDDCRIQKLVVENAMLKRKNKELREKNKRLEQEISEKSWNNPNIIGNSQEMGCW